MICSDWEGPWVTADHAFEICRKGIPNGDRLFAGISEYDDYLAYVRKKEGYEPGDTLSLIAPFLVAYHLDDQFLIDIAKNNANFIYGSLEAIKTLNKLRYPLNIISTSYCQYVHYTTDLAGIPLKNTRCTCFSIEKFSRAIKEADKKFIRAKTQDILNLPKLGISSSTKEKDLPFEVLETIQSLDHFFWRELPKTSFKQLLEEVKPLGGRRKFNALQELLEEEGKELYETGTIGDSITDWVMLKETRDAGGLAISFNGNDYAIKNANVAIVSNNCMITPIIIDLFRRTGIDLVEEITSNWNYEILKEAVQKHYIDSSLFRRFLEFINETPENLPYVTWVTAENLEDIIRRSKKMRKRVRGLTIGSLG